MATDKKSFLLYCDIIHTIEKLPNEKAGELFKHILQYVNDKEPQTDDLLIELAFEPIKQSLKRDLVKYENIREQKRLAGLASAEKRKQNQHVSTDVETVEHNTTDSTVIDSVSVSDSVSDIVKEEKEKHTIFNFKKALLELGIEKQLVDDWLIVRKLKKGANTKTAFNAIEKEITLSGLDASECVRIAVEKNWVGIKAEWINNIKPKQHEVKQSPKLDYT